MSGERRKALLTFLALGLAAPIGAQRGQTPSSPYTDTVDVRVVEVEVVVTDRSGNPVFGLQPDDFLLYDEGEEVRISNFYAVEGGRLAGPGGELSAPELDRGADVKPTFVVLLVDSTTMQPGNRRRAVGGILEHLDRLLDSSASVMVVHVLRGLKVEIPFSQDRALVQSSLERILETVPVFSGTSERRSIQLEMDVGLSPQAEAFAAGRGAGVPGAGSEGGIQQLLGVGAEEELQAAAEASLSAIRGYAASASSQFHLLQRQLRELVSSLASVPGRKAVLYVSGGYEERPGEELFRNWWNRYRRVARQLGVFSPEALIAEFDARSALRRLADHAATNGVVFYALDGNDSGFAGATAETRRLNTVGLARSAAEGRRNTLLTLAASTGGVALLNANVERMVDQMARSFDSYYSLGFVARESTEDGQHELKVKVLRKGLRVRHAMGYLEKTRAEMLEEKALAALLLGEEDNPLGATVELGEERPYKDGNYLLPVRVRVPFSSLVLLPEGDHHVGRLQLVTVAQDRRGTSAPTSTELPLAVSNRRLLSVLNQTVRYDVKLAVRSGEQKVAIGLRDEIGEQVSTFNVIATVGEGRRKP